MESENHISIASHTVTGGLGITGNIGITLGYSFSPQPWKFCAECGTKLEAAWKHCPQCGTRIGVQASNWPAFPVYPIYPGCTGDIYPLPAFIGTATWPLSCHAIATAMGN